MNNRLYCILLGIGVSLWSMSGHASVATSNPDEEGSVKCQEAMTATDVVVNEDTDESSSNVSDCLAYSTAVAGFLDNKEERESLFPKASKDLGSSHFTWGAEFGASIDLSGYDTSTFNVDAVFGYKNNYFRILGAGAGIHKSLGSRDNFIPVYAMMRTSFSTRPRLFFMSLKVGYSFNTMGDSPMFGDTNAQLGAGINLAMSKKFQSHIILAYEFRHFNKRHKYILNDKEDDISLATISFGVNF